MSILLSSYPLTRETLRALGEAPQRQAFTLAELRLLPLQRMVAAVRAIRGETLTVVVQEPSERAVLPLMLTLASLTRVRQLQVNDLAAGTVTGMGRARAALGVLGTISATIAGQWAIQRLRRQSRHLLQAEPLAFGPVASVKALYLKSNLMLGVKAGGSIGHIAGVANELLRLDSGMLVLAPEPPPMVRPEARFAPIETLRSYGVPAEANHFRFNAPCERAADALLAQEKFGFIYQRLSLGNLSGVLLSRRHRLPLVLEYNGSEVWISKNWGHQLKHAALAEAIENACLRHAHRVVTVSQVLADELRARGVAPERIVWYPNCIDPEVFDPASHAAARTAVRQRLGVADDELAVLFLGTFGVWHGAEVLAEAARRHLSEADDAGGPRLKFIFVGDGLHLARVRALVEPWLASGRVVLAGLVPQAQAPEYLAAADIFVSPHVPSTDGSKFFGSPTKLFEYMAMERAIVASDLDQLGDVLQPAVAEAALTPDYRASGEETAVLTAPGSAEAILRALQVLRLRPDLRTSLGQAARRRALGRYTWQRHVGELMRSLER